MTPASTSSSAPAHQAFQTAAFASARSSLCGSSFPQHLTSSTWIQQRVQVEEEFNKAENRADLVLWLSWIHIFKPVMLLPASPSSSRTLLKSPCHCWPSTPSGWVSCVQDVPREGWAGMSPWPWAAQRWPGDNPGNPWHKPSWTLSIWEDFCRFWGPHPAVSGFCHNFAPVAGFRPQCTGTSPRCACGGAVPSQIQKCHSWNSPVMPGRSQTESGAGVGVNPFCPNPRVVLSQRNLAVGSAGRREPRKSLG